MLVGQQELFVIENALAYRFPPGNKGQKFKKEKKKKKKGEIKNSDTSDTIHIMWLNRVHPPAPPQSPTHVTSRPSHLWSGARSEHFKELEIEKASLY